MDNDITDADLAYIDDNAAELDAELAAQEVFDPLDWTEEQEAGWAFEDKLSLYRNEY